MSHYLEFKYLKNHVIDIGDGKLYPIRFEMREINTPFTREVSYGGGKPRVENRAIMPVFFMDDVHRVELEDETVMAPEAVEGMSARLIQELEDEAFKASMVARAKNKIIRAKVAHYVKDGTIELVSDPFAVKMVAMKGTSAAAPVEPTKPIEPEAPVDPSNDESESEANDKPAKTKK